MNENERNSVYAETVAEVARLLDQDQPGWAHRVPDTWRLNDAHNCVLYHVYRAEATAAGDPHPYSFGFDRLKDLGYTPVGALAETGYEEFWRREIERRVGSVS